MLKLVDNKSKLHKSSTVVLSVALVILSILEIIQPYLATLEPVISPGIFPFVSAGIGIAVGIGRYIKQECVEHKEEENANLPIE